LLTGKQEEGMTEKLIFALMEKFNAGAVAELDYSDREGRLLLRKEGAGRGGPSPAVSEGPSETGVRLSFPAPAPENSAQGESITSPIVATFYSASGPDTPPFVKPGSRVKAGDTLCILEAMKMMNHLEAEFDCEILSVEAGSGELVEYGQVLFTVKRL
jgi:acetyl-CoA carboxylase biotin carboxyl carrier protein